MSKPFEFREHTADIRLIAEGSSFEELCVNAAKGMISWMFGDSFDEIEGQAIRITAKGDDYEDRLVEWLSHILWHCLTRYQAASSFHEVKDKEECLEGVVEFTPREALDEIKAVTYHDLHVREENGIWSAGVTFDI